MTDGSRVLGSTLSCASSPHFRPERQQRLSWTIDEICSKVPNLAYAVTARISARFSPPSSPYLPRCINRSLVMHDDSGIALRSR